jgi:hypothetical protein
MVRFCSPRAEVYLETDLLVDAAGTLFCAEIKNYCGVISHASATQVARSNITELLRHHPLSAKSAPAVGAVLK